MSVDNRRSAARAALAVGGVLGALFFGGAAPAVALGGACAPGWTPGPAHGPGRHLTAGALGTDGKFYTAGGVTDHKDGDFLLPTADAARYNPAANTWESIAPLPEPLGLLAMAAGGGKVYVAGGTPKLNTRAASAVINLVYIYDIATNRWSKSAPLPGASGVEGAGAAVVGETLYVLGGDNGSDLITDTSTRIYDIATDRWSVGAPLPDARSGAAVTTVNGTIYVFGGFNADGVRDDLQAYNPASNRWQHLAAAGTHGFGQAGGISPYGVGQLLAVDGGDVDFNPSTATHIYDIAANTWRPGPALNQAHLGAAQATLADGRVVVYGGEAVAKLGELTTASELLAPPCAVPVGMPRTGQGAGRDGVLLVAALVGIVLGLGLRRCGYGQRHGAAARPGCIRRGAVDRAGTRYSP